MKSHMSLYCYPILGLLLLLLLLLLFLLLLLITVLFSNAIIY